MSTDDVADPWADYDSGPFCRHWSEAWDCNLRCARCGHRCTEHELTLGGKETGCTECDCPEWAEPEAKTDTTSTQR